MTFPARPTGPGTPEDPFIPDLSEGKERGLYLALLELLDEGLVIASDEYILEVNSAACRLLERPYRALAGKPLVTLFPDEAAFLAARERLLILQQSRGVLQVIQPDGTPKDLEYIAAARLRPGMHAIILAPHRGPADHADNSDALWPRLASAMRQPVLVLDERQHVVAANGPAQALLHAQSGQLMDRPLADYAQITLPSGGRGRGELCLHSTPDIHHLARILPAHRPGWTLCLLDHAPEDAGNGPRTTPLFAAHPLPLLVCHPLSLRILEANPAATRLYGYEPATLLEMTLPQLRADDGSTGNDDLREGGVWSMQRSDGSRFQVEVLAFPLERGDAPDAIVLTHDWPEAPLLSSRLRMPLDIFSRDERPVMVCDGLGRILCTSGAFQTRTGYQANELVGRNASLLTSGKHQPSFFAGMWQSLQETGRWQGEIHNRYRDGQVHAEWLDITAVRTTDGRLLQYVGVFGNPEEQRLAQARSDYLATHDSLTGLPNMRQVESAFADAVEEARFSRCTVGLLKVDLDAFKQVNRRHGQQTGDQILRDVALRLRSALPTDCLVARKRSDAFVVLQPRTASLQQLQQLKEAAATAFATPVRNGEQQIPVQAHFGLARYPEDGIELEALLQHADADLTQARSTSPAPADNVESPLTWALRQARQHQELAVFFQPIVDVGEQRIVGAEALLRWHHPDKGLLGFAAFAAALRETGLERELGAWAMAQACQAARPLIRHVGAGGRLVLNVSLEELLDPQLPWELSRAIAQAELTPAAIELDLPEALFRHEDKRVAQAIHTLHGLGVGLAIDDFGLGPTSITTLAHYPVKRLKLPQALVAAAARGEQESLTVETILKIAGALGLAVVAKGVEDESWSDFLKALGCSVQQGMYCGEPVQAAVLCEQLG